MVKTLLANKLVRQVSLLLSGTMLVQLINFGFMPLVLRLYGPAEFGVLGTFNAVLLLLFPIAALCLPMAVVQGRNRTESRYIASVAWAAAVGFSALTLLLILLFKQQLLQLFSAENIGNLVFLLPLAMLFAARLQISQQLLIKQQQFKVLAKADVVQALLVNLARLLLGLWQSVAAILIAIASFAYLLHVALLRLFYVQSGNSWQPLGVLCHVSSRRYWLKLRRTLFRFRAFALFQTPQALLNAAAQSAPVLVLAAMYGSVAAGFYTLAKAILALPAMLLGRAVGDVFYPHFTNAYQQKKPLVAILLKASFSLAAIGLIPFSVFIVAGPWLFALIFGAEWQASGEYARWMAVWLYCAFINTPSVKAVMVLQVQHWAIALNILTLSLRLAALWYVGYITQDPVKAVAAFAMVGVLHSTLFTLMALVFSKMKHAAFADNIEKP